MNRSIPLALCAIASTATLAGGQFYALGVSDPERESRGWAVSADGTTVVGRDSGRGFAWRAETGKVLLSVEGSEAHSAVGVSAAGTLVLGVATIRTVPRAWLTNDANTPGIIVQPPNPEPIIARALSADGSAFVGQWRDDGDFVAFRWTATGGFQSLPDPRAYDAYAVNADATVVVGGPFPPFLWRDGEGLTELPAPSPGVEITYAYAVNADGSIAAGETTTPLGADAILWESGSYILLPTLPGAGYTAAYAVSGDGRVIAGRSSETGLTGYSAAVWDEGRRVIDPNAYLDSIGIDRGGLRLTFIRGLSHDGRTLAGWGERDLGDGESRIEAWVAVLDRPMSCAADLNADGGVGFGDLNTLLANFGCVGDDCVGDLDGNGAVGFGDLNELLSRFGIRCFDATPAR